MHISDQIVRPLFHEEQLLFQQRVNISVMMNQQMSELIGKLDINSNLNTSLPNGHVSELSATCQTLPDI